MLLLFLCVPGKYDRKISIHHFQPQPLSCHEKQTHNTYFVRTPATRPCTAKLWWYCKVLVSCRACTAFCSTCVVILSSKLPWRGGSGYGDFSKVGSVDTLSNSLCNIHSTAFCKHQRCSGHACTLEPPEVIVLAPDSSIVYFLRAYQSALHARNKICRQDVCTCVKV